MFNIAVIPSKIINHVQANKLAYAAGAVAIAAIALQQRNRIDFYEFLNSEGIDPEKFYCPEAYAEKNA